MSKLALVLAGGGARAAYQAGVLRTIADHFPETRFDVITGVSAGAINALYLASRDAPLRQTARELCELWEHLRVEDVFRVDMRSLGRNLFGWSFRLISGGGAIPHVRGLVDTKPLRNLLADIFPQNGRGIIAGVSENLARCQPEAVGITTLNYSTGQTVTWAAGCEIHPWDRPLRRSITTEFTIDHIMASAALPLLFPAVRLGGAWYGDGGIRLAAPLSPALLLGADRILAISTHYAKSLEEAEEPTTAGYPPPAQILGQLMSAVFLDMLDEDALRLERSNEFLRDLPPEKRHGYRLVDLTVARPSRDLGKLAAHYEPRLPSAFRFLTRGLGTRETASPDFLSLLMFQPDYLRELVATGAEDAEHRIDEIARVVGGGMGSGL
ncbi:MAG TPA: patatin-like phospholipase family protein [Thermoanaerobaculia bacterium]|jgi:NTE family protein|nr:patatin-like phospholipase family protein [Thermoanaerobaculia bacterium]